MPATFDVLSGWFDQGVREGATHMVVRCDRFEFRGCVGDRCCYPVYVTAEEDAREVAEKGGDRLMEVYDLRMDKAEQFQGRTRVFNY